MKLRTMIALLLCVMMTAGCSQMTISDEYPVTIAGYTFETSPQSIVCLDDSVADILIACGFSEQIKARSQECTQEEIADVKQVGKKNAPDADKILSVKPDIVFAEKELADNVRKKLADKDIKVITMVRAKNNQELSVLYESLATVAGGKKSGKTTGAEKAESIILTMGDLQRIIPEQKILITACYLYDTKGNAAYDDSFAGKLLSYANADNVCKNDDGDVIQKITLSNPQYIFCDTGVKDQLKAEGAFKNLNAVKNDRIYEIDKSLFERQGNSITEVLSFMIETMYPELNEPKQESSEPSVEESSEEESSEPSVEESSEEESSEPSVEESSEIIVEADDSLTITPYMNYRLGEEDDNVTIIQNRLKTLGYLKEEPTGIYDEKTAEAVMAYEETNRLENPDGNLSNPELYLLFSNEVLPNEASR